MNAGLNSARKQKLWRMFDALMKRWDRIDEEAEQLFEETHRWLFHPGEKPEIIENEETITRENNINEKRKHLFAELNRVMAELFPPKEPTPPEQGRLLPGTPEVRWTDH